MKKYFRIVFIFLFGLIIITDLAASDELKNSTLEKIKQRGYLLWGSDAEGGAPYVFPDPDNPNKLIGFEVDLAEMIAKEMGVKAKQVQVNWVNLVPSLERADFDLAINGLEITPQREKKVLFTLPYYIYLQQIVVRAHETNIASLDDLRDKKVGTLGATTAQNILESAGGINTVIYDGQVQPYVDLALGRLDAVLLDYPIAAYYGKPNPKLKFAGEPFAEGLYGIAMRKNNADLKAEIDRIIAKLLKDGTLKRMYEKWKIWNPAQEGLFQYANKEAFVSFQNAKDAPIVGFLPSLLKAAGITVALSCTSMAVAIALGLLLAITRLYGPSPINKLPSVYVEIYRGTPLLIQLYILYYGLPNMGINLTPLMTAIIGLGMNYAAYEAEIYRAGISAVPKGQMEAALSLGMKRSHAIKKIILPQATRITLPAVTNDFIALFKDSSIVSVITMVELTKTYNILATTTLRYLELGLIAAFLYFAMSYPLSLIAKSLETKLKKGLK